MPNIMLCLECNRAALPNDNLCSHHRKEAEEESNNYDGVMKLVGHELERDELAPCEHQLAGLETRKRNK